MMRSRYSSIVVFVFVFTWIVPIARAQDHPPSSYTKDEIDAKLKELESKADADTGFGEVYKRSEIDAQLKDLRNLISQNATKAELDAKAVALQKAFDAAIASAEKTNAERKENLEKQIQAVDSKIPVFPSWVGAVLSALAIAMSIWMGNRAIRTSTNIANDSREETRRATREASAYSLIGQWRSLSERIGRAWDLFDHPDKLHPNDENHRTLVDLGNWFEGMAEQWRSGTADAGVLGRSGMKDEAKRFSDGLQVARQTLPDLNGPIADWTDLQWLAAQP